MSYNKEEYQRNKASHAERQRRYKKKHKDAINKRQAEYRADTPSKIKAYRQKKYNQHRAMLDAYKEGKTCACGYDKPCSLDFHHRDPSTKLFAVSKKIGKISWARIEAEIAKCDLLCRNCHGELHAGT